MQFPEVSTPLILFLQLQIFALALKRDFQGNDKIKLILK